METVVPYRLDTILKSIEHVIPEIILSCGVLLIIFAGLFSAFKKNGIIPWITIGVFAITLFSTLYQWNNLTPANIFDGMIRGGSFSIFFKILFDIAGILTVLMSLKNEELKENRFGSEYFTLIVAAVLGAHLLTMTTNFVMVFLSLELLSISSYVLAGYGSSKKAAEGSLKYFLFGSVASAVMLYGFSILFGITGTPDFSSYDFASRLLSNHSALILAAGLMALAGFLYKVAAAPMHPWAPDVYEAAPLPVVAFLSTVPKFAGIAVLTKFALTLHFYPETWTPSKISAEGFDWQLILSVIAIVSITIGNFSALWQNNPKRMMAYSSIAQTGFLLIGVVCASVQGIQFMLFYASTYLLANFTIFFCLQFAEQNGINSIQSFSGWGKSQVLISVVLLIGFISLTGIPPTAGFTAKLFIFTSLWSAYEQTGNNVLVWLLVVGLLNTVVSIFFYLKIPYFSFIKTSDPVQSAKKTGLENYLALILVVLILFLFIRPDLLMGWLNRINFVL